MKHQVQIPQKMAALKAILLSLWMLIYGSAGLFAQQGTVAAGGVAFGSGGTATYSTGLVSYISATGTGGKINQGLQQPSTAVGKFIPGKIEAEDFDAKFGSQFATPTTDAGGGLKVVGITNGSWMDYKVTVTQSGTYTVNFRVATTQAHAQFQIISGSTVLATINIPNTGDWNNWVTVPVTNVILTAGPQTIRIQSTNNENCDFNWTDWVLTASNTAPTANAGPPQTIVLPTNQVTLSGSGAANNGGTITYAWTRVSGPNDAPALTIVSPTAASTNVTGLIQGVYTFRLTVTRNDNQAATSDVTVTVNPASGKFIPGKIEAEDFDTKVGPQYAIATTDAGGGLKVVGLINGSSMDYNVMVTQSGTYTINFRVATTKNNAQFQVKSGATLVATINIPSTGDWNNWVTVPVTNVLLTAGPQTIRIQSTNNENCDFNWTDWVLTASGTAPSANAGPNQTIVLPTNQVTLSGSGAANNGGTITYAWTRVSGPNDAPALTIVSPTAASTNVTGLIQGTYVFRLTVTRNDNQAATSDVTVTVNPASGKFIPGKIEAEDFDTKVGPQYAIATTDAGGGLKVVGLINGSSMDYNVMVTQSGTYTINFRVATTKNNAQFQVKSGATLVATINIPNTGDWNNWVTVPVNNVPLTAGPQTIRIQSTNNENCDFNWTDWIFVAPPATIVNNAPVTEAVVQKGVTVNDMVLSVFPNPASSYFNLKVQSKSMDLVTIRVVDIAGRQVQQMQGIPGQVLRLGDQLVKGTYLVEVSQGSQRMVTKVVKQ